MEDDAKVAYTIQKFERKMQTAGSRRKSLIDLKQTQNDERRRELIERRMRNLKEIQTELAAEDQPIDDESAERFGSDTKRSKAKPDYNLQMPTFVKNNAGLFVSIGI